MKKKIKQLNNQKTQLAVFFCVTVFLFSYYGYLINNTILNVVDREEKQHKIEQLGSVIGDLENKAYTLKSIITLDYAQSLGFQKFSNATYISHELLGNALSMNEIR